MCLRLFSNCKEESLGLIIPVLKRDRNYGLRIIHKENVVREE